jgi:hypothetical protein
MCNEEIKEPFSSCFADTHITANPGHLEYRIIIEMPSADVPDNESSLVFYDVGNIRVQNYNNKAELKPFQNNLFKLNNL